MVERCGNPAERMDELNSGDVTDGFRRPAEMEGKHLGKVGSLSKDRVLARFPPLNPAWQDKESLEAPESLSENRLLYCGQG